MRDMGEIEIEIEKDGAKVDGRASGPCAGCPHGNPGEGEMDCIKIHN